MSQDFYMFASTKKLMNLLLALLAIVISIVSVPNPSHPADYQAKNPPCDASYVECQ